MTPSKNPPNPLPRVVVVNDDTTQLNILCGLLHKAGLEATAFKSAETALAAMGQDLTPDLMITDIYMPGIDGWRFCRLLRSQEFERFNRMPILVVSATFSGEEPSRITSDLGANAFLPMPVDGPQFIEQVRALLRGEKPPAVLKVLIVEDSPLISGRLLQAFRAHGYQADAALTYQEALSRIGQTAYDIAVMDYHLPDGLGDGLLQVLRCTGQTEQSADCVCLMITADPQPELALTWMKMGAAAYLQKPFDPEYLIALCERARRERALLRSQDLLEVRTRQLQDSEQKYRSLIQHASDPIFAFNPDESYRFVNEAFARPFGKKPEEIIGKTPHAIFSADEAEKRLTLVRRVFMTGEKGEIDVKVVTPTGGERYYLTLADPIKDEQGQVLYVTCISKDITERKRAEEAWREEENLLQQMVSFTEELLKTGDDQITYQKILENLLSISKAKYGAFTLLKESTGKFTTVAVAGLPDGLKNIAKMLGFELVGKEWPEYSTDNERLKGKVVARFSSMSQLAGRVIPEIISRPIEKLFNLGEVMVTKVIVNNQMIGDFTLIMPVGKRFENDYLVEIYSRQIDMFMTRMKADEALRESEERYHTVVSNMPVVTFVTDEKGIFTLSEGKGLEKLGLRPNQVSGLSLFDVYHDYPVIIDAMKNVLAGYSQRNEVDVQGIVFDVIFNPVFDPNGKIVKVIGVSNDVTERKRAEVELRRAQDELESAHRELQQSFARDQALARIDDLTGINNHRSLLQLAEHEFNVAMRYRPPLAMLFFDIDHFKQINDTFGHLMGDQALKKMIEVVCAEMRSADVIGRYGGDEFVILLPQTSAQEALPFADRIHSCIAALRLETDKGPLTLTVSIGIAQTIHDPGQPDAVESLLLRADQALYAAKQAGRNCTMIFAADKAGAS